MKKALRNQWRDELLRIDMILHIPTMMCLHNTPYFLQEYLSEEYQSIAPLLGLEVEQLEEWVEADDWESLSDYIHNNNLKGFIVDISTPVPKKFNADGTYDHDEWRSYVNHHVRLAQLDNSLWESAMNWKKNYLDQVKAQMNDWKIAHKINTLVNAGVSQNERCRNYEQTRRLS